MIDTFKTIETKTEAFLYKEKNSKFFGIAYSITSENEVKPILEELKKNYIGAGHFCYAYQLGTELISYRANDDGEPNNSAGMPIYRQIQSRQITNVLVVVIRFFGGVKLGVGGLISAYRTTANLTLESAIVVEKIMYLKYKLLFEYPALNKVMRIIKEQNLSILSQNLELSCEIFIEIRKKNTENIVGILNKVIGIRIVAL